METLARWAAYLAIAGGALATLLVVIVAYDPATPAWSAFFIVVALLGAAVLGLEERTKAATGQLGRWSGWLSALGALGILVIFAYAAATNQLANGSGSSSGAAADPLAPLWTLTAVAWFIGTMGYSVAIIRAKALSPIGGWLVLAGTLAGVAVSVALGENLPSVVLLLFGLFGVGWIVVGFSALRQPSGAV